MFRGYHTAESRDDLIIVCLIGSFNEFDIMGYIDDLREFILGRQGKPAYLIVNDFELDGITPEGYLQLEINNQWLLTQNLVAKAIVSNRSIQDSLDFKWTPTLKKLNTRYFADMASAEGWVKQLKNVDVSSVF